MAPRRDRGWGRPWPLHVLHLTLSPSSPSTHLLHIPISLSTPPLLRRDSSLPRHDDDDGGGKSEREMSPSAPFLKASLFD